jgi:hypothetical protein
MIYRVQLLIALCIVIAFLAEAFHVPASKFQFSPVRMALADYKEELAKNAKLIAGPGIVMFIWFIGKYIC